MNYPHEDGAIKLRFVNQVAFIDTYYDLEAKAAKADLCIKKRQFVEENGDILVGRAYWQAGKVKPTGVHHVKEDVYEIQEPLEISQFLQRHSISDRVTDENFGLKEVKIVKTVRKEYRFKDNFILKAGQEVTFLIYKPEWKATEFTMMIDETYPGLGHAGYGLGKFELRVDDICAGMQKMRQLIFSCAPFFAQLTCQERIAAYGESLLSRGL